MVSIGTYVNNVTAKVPISAIIGVRFQGSTSKIWNSPNSHFLLLILNRITYHKGAAYLIISCTNQIANCNITFFTRMIYVKLYFSYPIELYLLLSKQSLLRVLFTFGGHKNSKIWKIQISKISSTYKTWDIIF